MPPLDPAPTARSGLSLRSALVLAAIAFLIGLVATAYLLSRWDGWRSWIGAREAGEAQVAAQAAPAATVPQQPSSPRVQPSMIAAMPNPYAAPGSDPIAEAAMREAQLAGRMATREALPDAADARASIEAMRASSVAMRPASWASRMASIDARASAASGNASRAEGILVAFAARRALDRGLGLGYIEAQLRDRFGPSQPRAVAVVIQASRNPITLEALRIGLDELAPELTTGIGEVGWWQATRRELSNLVVLRRTGTPSPRPVDRLTRARRMLEGGQVDAALAEVARLPGREKATQWMVAARRYNQARRALDILETAAILEPQEANASAASVPAGPAALPPATN